MKKIYDGDIHADSEFDMRSPQHQYEQATFYTWLDLSGDATVDWALKQVYDHHKGRLFGLKPKEPGKKRPKGREEIDLDKVEPEDLFGVDTRRTINAFKAKAVHYPRQRLHEDLVERAMWLDFAQMIFIKRME